MLFIFCSRNYLLVVTRGIENLEGCWDQVRSQDEQTWAQGRTRESLNFILVSKMYVSLELWIHISSYLLRNLIRMFYNPANLHVSKIEVIIVLLHQRFVTQSYRLTLWSLSVQWSRQPLPWLKLAGNLRKSLFAIWLRKCALILEF